MIHGLGCVLVQLAALLHLCTAQFLIQLRGRDRELKLIPPIVEASFLRRLVYVGLSPSPAKDGNDKSVAGNVQNLAESSAPAILSTRT